jgi:DNA-binding CsgD family transcriptional regulator
VDNAEAIYAVLRSPGQEAFGMQESNFLKRLNPHLQRATQIHERLFQSEAKAAMGASALHRFEHPLLVTDKQGRVLFCNKAAESLLRSDNTLSLSRGVVALPSATDQRALEHLLDFAVTRRQGGGMRLRRAGGGDDLHLVTIPLAPDLGMSNPWERPLAMVLILDGRSKRQFNHNDAALLRQTFGLTPAEARAALALCNGGSIEETAAGLGISANTLKSQLRSIYQKTGVDSRARLVKLVLVLAGVGRASCA